MLNCAAMSTPPADLAALRERTIELTVLLREALDSGRQHASMDPARLLGDALLQLFTLLEHLQAGDPAGGIDEPELNTLGEFGLQRLEELAQLARDAGQSALAGELERLCLPFALWLARQGGEIRHLQPVVNALAHQANRSSNSAAMAELYGHCCELIDAVSPKLQETSPADPQQPWRLLLLNRAIVATRSESPELMQAAFDAIVEQLPFDAQRFFAEGMEQMAIIDYPEPVREVMRRYYLANARPQRLH